jgi:hypothetical protein
VKADDTESHEDEGDAEEEADDKGDHNKECEGDEEYIDNRDRAMM